MLIFPWFEPAFLRCIADSDSAIFFFRDLTQANEDEALGSSALAHAFVELTYLISTKL